MAFSFDDSRFLALLTGMAESQIIVLDTIRMRVTINILVIIITK